VIGIDNFAALDRWPGVESVVRNTTYAVARRRGAGEAEVEDLRLRLGTLGVELTATLFDLTAHQSAASTVVREQIRVGVQPESLDARVYDYILANSLYS
jgi:nicotinic acid mononucleotide adenylyltransferase